MVEVACGRWRLDGDMVAGPAEGHLMISIACVELGFEAWSMEHESMKLAPPTGVVSTCESHQGQASFCLFSASSLPGVWLLSQLGRWKTRRMPDPAAFPHQTDI